MLRALAGFHDLTNRGVTLRAASGLCLLTCVAIMGCDSRPQAPALRNSPVYQSTTEGFRFRVPEGWSQTANSALPAGELPKDIFLVRYDVESQEGGASLQVLARNDLPVEDVTKHFQQPAFGIMQWKLEEPLTRLDIHGVPADRLVLSGVQNGKTLVKHVTAIHRGGRLYAFVGLYWQSDKTIRQQVERAVESLVWE